MPVTAINSAILVCAAILYGCRYVVFSNERSADEPTLHAGDGRAINHQYSKSSAFESAFRAEVARHVSPSIEYFSVLRPFSELAVVQRFSALTAFHGAYSSCNRNFPLDGPRLEGRWCRDCPKCRFAALSLALFLTPTEVSAILGGDLLDEPGQEEGFRALCQLGRDKPFECVGEAGESRAALVELAAREAWRDHVVVRRLAPEAARVEAPRLETLLQPSARHFIPDAISRRLGLPLAARPAPAETEFEGGKVGDMTRKRTVVGVTEEAGEAGFEVRPTVDEAVCLPGHVLAVFGIMSEVATADGQVYRCTTRRLLRTLSSDERHVVVAGDHVMIRREGADEGVIERIEPRRGVLSRASRGKRHVIVANVDQMFIMASAAQPEIEPNLIDRFLVVAEQARIRPIICVNKVDLIDPADLQPLIGVYGQMGYVVLCISVKTGLGVQRAREFLRNRQSAVQSAG